MKFMNHFSLYLITCVIFAAIANARLGESAPQLTERFGPHARTLPDKIITQGRIVEIGEIFYFRDGDWSISATIIDGRCAKISYTKKGEWTDTQITQTLNANSQGAPWSMTSDASIHKSLREWKRNDGGKAKWTASGLTLFNPAYDRAIAKAAAKADAESRKTPKI
jgi:hypothetical protein